MDVRPRSLGTFLITLWIMGCPSPEPGDDNDSIHQTSSSSSAAIAASSSVGSSTSHVPSSFARSSSSGSAPSSNAVHVSSSSGSATSTGQLSLAAIWANEGGDKVPREDRRAAGHPQAVVNATWDGNTIHLFGARNEVVSFCVILEAGSTTTGNLSVNFHQLLGPGGATIGGSPATGAGLWQWQGRNIELFFVRYLPIRGLSHFGQEFYDERHVPTRFQRPWTGEGEGHGTWTDRPDHDKAYPDIAVPLELEPSFTVAAQQSQSIWVDIYIPRQAPAGMFTGTLSVTEQGHGSVDIPVELTVRNFTLPEQSHARTMLFFGDSQLDSRYTGIPFPEGIDDAAFARMNQVRDRHFLLARRHRIELVDGNSGTYSAEERPTVEWLPRLDGSLFTAAHGNDGPGEGLGSQVFVVGMYGSWSWQEEGESAMRTHTDAWETWFRTHAPTTERFLYLIDESDNYPQTEQWARWVKDNPGVGQHLPTFATISYPNAVADTPSLSIACASTEVGITQLWQSALDTIQSTGGKLAMYYNGKRPGSGAFMTEDPGTDLRMLPWVQTRFKLHRWFYWESTYYQDTNNGAARPTNVFEVAHTFGPLASQAGHTGETGDNYSNGDGVLFYPGTDLDYPDHNYGVPGPFASLRLKHWRRGIQDADYLALASAINPTATQAILLRMIPKVLWENGVDDPEDPTWKRCPVSWSENPDDWEQARAELADIIDPR